jgi:hypothetical protein
MIRVDFEFVRAESSDPTIALLRGKQFSGAQAEFLKAHEHYRQTTPKRDPDRACKSSGE